MDEILTDLSPTALANAVEENLYAFSPFSHNWKQTEVYSSPEICWCVTDFALTWCNVAFHTNLKAEQVDSTIKKFIAKGNERKVGLQWFIGKNTKPANLGKKLITHGFTQGDAVGMAIDLNQMNEDVPLPDGLKIIEVKDDKTLKTWCHVTSVGFGFSRPDESSLFEWLTTDIQHKQPLKLYLGLLRGKPVATSMYFLGAGVVGLYLITTLPEARNKGIGFALTQKPLIIGRNLGYRAGVLTASKLGKPVYKKMGFKKYCKIGCYTWLPKTE